MAEVNAYQIGDVIRLTAEFRRESDDALVDPTNVKFMWIKPSTPTTITTKIYATDIEVIRDSLGVYHIDISITESKRWYVRAEGYGANNAGAQESEFEVEDSRFYS